MRQTDLTYEEFVAQIRQRTGIDLSLYKQEQMQRRLKGSMERAGADGYGAYLRLLDTDPRARQVFLDRLTINVSELFRNPEHFNTLAERVLPEVAAGKRSVRIWSAGCSYGAEPVSLAVLALEKLPGVSCEILATDIDESILKAAAKGEFQDPDMKNVNAQRRARWFSRDGSVWRAKPELMRLIRFLKHNLLADSAPGVFDLIVCRNVVIYFGDEAKDRVNRMFFQALRPGGYLFVGGTERVADSEQIGFDNPLPFFYRRPR